MFSWDAFRTCMRVCIYIHLQKCVYVLVSALLLIQLCVFYNFLFNFFVQQIAVVQHFCRQTALNDRQTDVQAERLMRIYNMADMIETKHPPPKKRNFCFSLLPLEIGNCVRWLFSSYSKKLKSQSLNLFSHIAHMKRWHAKETNWFVVYFYDFLALWS